MSRIPMIDPSKAQGQAKQLLDAVNQSMGKIPNAVKVMANSPAVLEAFLGIEGAMQRSAIGPKLLTQVKLTASESNECTYCTSLLSAVAPKAGLSAEEVLANRAASSSEKRTKAALAFAHDVLEKHGRVEDAALAKIRAAGFGDAEIVEIVIGVVMSCFTNFLNNVADTTLDAPLAAALHA